MIKLRGADELRIRREVRGWRDARHCPLRALLVGGVFVEGGRRMRDEASLTSCSAEELAASVEVGGYIIQYT